MSRVLLLFQPWRGGCRQMIIEDYIAGFSLLLLVIIIGRQEALLFETPSSLMSLYCLVYTSFLIHAKNRWPRAANPRAILALLASVVAVSITFIPGPRLNAWITALVGLCGLNLFHHFLDLAWREFREAFTPGEVLLLSQAGAMLIFSTVMDLLSMTRALTIHEMFLTSPVSPIPSIARTAVVCAVVVFIVSVQNPQNFCQILTAAILFGIGHVILAVGNPVTWFLKFLLEGNRIYIILFWIGAVSTCLPVLLYYRCDVTDEKSRDPAPRDPSRDAPSTVTRKFFHLVILAIFLPGLFLDTPLLYLASALAMAGLIVLETIRLLDIPPFGHVISGLFSSFQDRQDRSRLLLTPLYLLAACALPLWLCGANVRREEEPPLILFLGSMTVGVGDAAAAVFGSKFGSFSPAFQSGRKSAAGFNAGLMSQFIFWLVLIYAGVEGEHCIMPVIILVSSLTETFTSHVDNLVLPVYTTLLYLLLEFCLQSYRKCTENAQEMSV